MQRYKDKVAIVTGGGGGIGGATCRRLASEGAKVAVYDINEEAANSVVADIEKTGGIAAPFIIDLCDYNGVQKTVADTVERLGPISVLVNNAGWDKFTPFMKSTPDFWQHLININLMTTLNMTHAVLPHMIDNGYGRVVNIASDAARVGSSGESVYAACKGGIVSFSKTLAREHSRQGITFNVVCPGVTETGMLEGFMESAGDPEKLRVAFTRAIPLGRLGQAEDLPGAISFLGSDDAAFVTGQVLSVSGGMTMAG